MARKLTGDKPKVQYWPLNNRANKAGIFERQELFPECTRGVYRLLKKQATA